MYCTNNCKKLGRAKNNRKAQLKFKNKNENRYRLDPSTGRPNYKDPFN